ncbi:hypothetical protein IEQ34_014857 [Dendrobium chrysotoxum]|uniref:Uncharacterized protein n=1 Tax=Dendrobium chrysotoxum TaxID=161865 RepID=A0AAV7GMW5_DENCH|nr:hypothetical protein IEQ34_014857 [Dendrobium chrysotoxum]
MRLRMGSFHGETAHPKKDPSTGELFSFQYGPVPPFLTYFRFDTVGKYKTWEDVPIFLLAQPSMVHDSAITEWFAIFRDIQIMMKPIYMVVPGGGSPIGSDQGNVPRLGILPKYAWADAEMR